MSGDLARGNVIAPRHRHAIDRTDSQLDDETTAVPIELKLHDVYDYRP